MTIWRRTGLLMLAGAAAAFCTACQPTPEEPVVVGKAEGVMESALAATPCAEATPYDAPDHLAFDVDVPVENYSIVFDAEVIVPDQTAYPVYTVRWLALRSSRPMRFALRCSMARRCTSRANTAAARRYS